MLPESNLQFVDAAPERKGFWFACSLGSKNVPKIFSVECVSVFVKYLRVMVADSVN